MQSQWRHEHCHIIDIIAAIGIATQEAKASTIMILAQSAQNDTEFARHEQQIVVQEAISVVYMSQCSVVDYS